MKKNIILFLLLTTTSIFSNNLKKVILESSMGLNIKYEKFLSNLFPNNKKGTQFEFTNADIKNLIKTLNIVKYELDLNLKNIENADNDGYKRIQFIHAKINNHEIKDSFTLDDYSNYLNKCTRVDITQGSLKTTNSYDISIAGDGFFRLVDEKNEFKYLRNLYLSINKDGTIIDITGLKIPEVRLKNKAGETLYVNDHGELYYKTYDDKIVNITQLKLFKLTEVDKIIELEDGIFEYHGNRNSIIVGEPGVNNFGTPMNGMKEVSNVDLVDEYTNIIILERLRSMIIDTIHKLDNSYAVDYSNSHSNAYLQYQNYIKNKIELKEEEEHFKYLRKK